MSVPYNAWLYYQFDANETPNVLCELYGKHKSILKIGCALEKATDGVYRIVKEGVNIVGANHTKGQYMTVTKGFGRYEYGKMFLLEFFSIKEEDSRNYILINFENEEPEVVPLSKPPFTDVTFAPAVHPEHGFAVIGTNGIWYPLKNKYLLYEVQPCDPFACDWVQFNINNIFIGTEEGIAIHDWNGMLKNIIQLPSDDSDEDVVIATGWVHEPNKVLTMKGIAIINDLGDLEEFMPYESDKLNYGYVLMGFMPQAFNVSNGQYGILIDDYSIYRVDLDTGEIKELADAYKLQEMASVEPETIKIFKGADITFKDKCTAFLWSRAFPNHVFQLDLC